MNKIKRKELLILAQEYLKQGNHQISHSILIKITEANPFDSIANELLARIAEIEGRSDLVSKYLLRSCQQGNGSAEALYTLGSYFLALGKYSQAENFFKESVQKKGAYFEGCHDWGIALAQQNKKELALSKFIEAKGFNRTSYELCFNLGLILEDLKRYDEAIDHYDQAIQLKPDYAEAFCNKGAVLYDLLRYEEALSHYDRAIQIRPDYAEAWSNKGLLLSALLRYDEAIQHYDRAIQIRPDYAEAWSNKGALLSQLKHYEEALNSYEHAFKLKQNIPGLLGEIIYAKLLVGDWFGLDDKLNDLAEKIRSGNVSVTPFVALSLIDNQKAQLELTKNWTEYRYPLQKNQTSYSFNNQKIRIAYISADFRSHPVGFLTVGLFESHDRSKFEIYGISLKSYKNDEFSERLAHGFDKFFKVEKLSDVEIAKFCREKKINIAVDLNGHTQDSRVGLFRGRLAPIQVNLIGHPNTMGAEFIDYIIADEVVIPKKDFHLYSERVVYLPDSFQPNDSKQAAPEKTLSRNAVGLPESGFIFCCFNSVHKINPNVFSVWMKILSSTTNSYLWMLSDSPLVKINLSKEAKIRGVDPTRLIFGQRLSRNEYMKRFHLANLFLDTLPFNGGATVSDALWSGLPILTQIGNGFQGRMAASLLRASELPELIAESQEEYVAKAIELANNSDLLINYRKKLEEKRKLLPLFDTQKYTKSLEKAYIQMATRFNQGLDPAHIDITDNSNKIFKKAT